MNLTVHKTTTTTNTVNWETQLTDETGLVYATISGKADSSRPFGSLSLTVHNQTAFKANEAAAKAAYDEFERQFDELINAITPFEIVNEEGALIV